MRAEMVEKKAKDAADKTKKADSEGERRKAKKQVECEQRKLQKGMRKTFATKTATTVVGGEQRQQAASQDKAALKRYDKVSRVLGTFVNQWGICPMGFDFLVALMDGFAPAEIIS